MPAFRNILVPVDFSENAAEAIEIGAQLAEDEGGSVRVVHVRQSSPVRYAIQEGLLEPGDDDSTIEHKVSEHLGAQIDAFLAPLGERASTVEKVVLYGDPSREIVDYARSHDIDLIVMGRRGTTLADVMLGSVAERVIRHADCPVLIAKGPRNE